MFERLFGDRVRREASSVFGRRRKLLCKNANSRVAGRIEDFRHRTAHFPALGDFGPFDHLQLQPVTKSTRMGP